MKSEWIAIIVPVVISLLAAAVIYGKLQQQVAQNLKDQTHNDERFKQLYDDRNQMKLDLVKMEVEPKKLECPTYVSEHGNTLDKLSEEMRAVYSILKAVLYVNKAQLEIQLGKEQNGQVKKATEEIERAEKLFDDQTIGSMG
jgi:hypothetical protein